MNWLNLIICIQQNTTRELYMGTTQNQPSLYSNPIDSKEIQRISGNCKHKKLEVVMVLAWHSQKRLLGLTGGALDHRSLPPEFESRRGHIWRVFHPWLSFIILGGRSAHLAYHVNKSVRKTSIITLSNYLRMSAYLLRNFKRIYHFKMSPAGLVHTVILWL